MTVQELIGRRFKDGRNVTHLVMAGSSNRNVGGADIQTVCDLRYNVIPEISLRKRGNVDCMTCLVRAR
jgi:hypothetical protein